MNVYDIIYKKRCGKVLTDGEIRFLIDGFSKEEIPDYQMSAFAMAVFFNGMNDEEISSLTFAMAESGDTVDLSKYGELTVDKHSTGGVGDKTTLVIAPIAAACGCIVAKMSGRGLGHTGGTIDKLESIPGLRTDYTSEEFISQVDEIGIAVIGPTGNFVPADKKLYALRDVTATVDSIPLITSSIMSKKIAAGSKSIVLDVKAGSGSFMKTREDAVILAEKMVDIGAICGRKMAAIISNMDAPLGYAVGNSLEVKEAISVLRGEAFGELRDVCIELAANMISLGQNKEIVECRIMAADAIDSGCAFKKFKEWIGRQGGDIGVIENPDLFPAARFESEVKAPCDGYISSMNTEEIGMCASVLGAGRQKKDDMIDMTAGILFRAKTGDFVKKNDTIALLYSSDEDKLHEADERLHKSLKISDEASEIPPHIYKIIKR